MCTYGQLQTIGCHLAGKVHAQRVASFKSVGSAVIQIQVSAAVVSCVNAKSERTVRYFAGALY